MALGLFLGRHRSLGNDCLREHRSENTFVCDTSNTIGITYRHCLVCHNDLIWLG